LPVFVYFYSRVPAAARSDTNAQGQAAGAGGDLLLSMRLGWSALAAFLAVNTHYKHIPALWHSDATEVVQELRNVEVRHPAKTIQMGYGDALDGPGYAITMCRAQLVFWGQPYTFDASALMERGEAGMAFPSQLTSDLKAGRPELVLIPKGNHPFRQMNF